MLSAVRGGLKRVQACDRSSSSGGGRRSSLVIIDDDSLCKLKGQERERNGETIEERRDDKLNKKSRKWHPAGLGLPF